MNEIAAMTAAALNSRNLGICGVDTSFAVEPELGLDGVDDEYDWFGV